MEEKRQLTPYEIAAITGGVPMTGDPHLDAIISASLRLKTATQLAAAMITAGYKGSEVITTLAIHAADDLINAFQEGTKNGKKTTS